MHSSLWYQDNVIKRIVIKVGSAVLTENNALAYTRMQNLVDLIAALHVKHYEVVLISSGAVSAGYSRLALDKKILSNKQALAAIGQPLLLNTYKDMFKQLDIVIAQVLVTSANFHNSEQDNRVVKTINTLLENGVVPIVNENDATAVEELVLGDNDQLSAYVAVHIDADLLIMLSDIDAYFDKDPNVHEDALERLHVESISESELEKDVTPNNDFATGGIVTKLKAAAYMLKVNKPTYLASGFDLSNVSAYLLERNHKGGTLFSKDKIEW